jgi:hypothetical protein
MKLKLLKRVCGWNPHAGSTALCTPVHSVRFQKELILAFKGVLSFEF